MVKTRVCYVCKIEKKSESFSKCNQTLDGLYSYCRDCRSLLRKKDRKDNPEMHRRWDRTPARRFSKLRATARQRDIPMAITRAYFEKLRLLPCYYCGGSLPEVGTGLDRIDSKKGYTQKNVRPCCTQCNTMKMDYTEQEFLGKIATILNYTKGNA